LKKESAHITKIDNNTQDYSGVMILLIRAFEQLIDYPRNIEFKYAPLPIENNHILTGRENFIISGLRRKMGQYANHNTLLCEECKSLYSYHIKTRNISWNLMFEYIEGGK
jgi:hypothetical protein